MDEVKRVAFEMRPIEWGTTPSTKGRKFYHLFKFTSACEFAQKREAAGAANTERPKEKS